MRTPDLFWTPFRTSFGANTGGASRRLLHIHNASTTRKRLVIRAWRLNVTSGNVTTATTFAIQVTRMVITSGSPANGSVSSGVHFLDSAAASVADVRFDADASGAAITVGTVGTESLIDGVCTSAATNATGSTAPPAIGVQDFGEMAKDSFKGIVLNPGQAFGFRQHQSFASQAGLIADGYVVWSEEQV